MEIEKFFVEGGRRKELERIKRLLNPPRFFITQKLKIENVHPDNRQVPFILLVLFSFYFQYNLRIVLLALFDNLILNYR